MSLPPLGPATGSIAGGAGAQRVLDWNGGAIRFDQRLGAKLNDWLRYGLDEGEIRKLAGT